MDGLPKIVDKAKTTIANMSYPTCDIQRSKEVVCVIQEAKVGEKKIPWFSSQYLEGLHSSFAFKMKIKLAHIDEKLNALAMDKRQYPLAMYNIKSSKNYSCVRFDFA
jgi:hypothetical protein